MTANASWSTRLNALDAASKRLADKTHSLNRLLHNLQHVNNVVIAPTQQHIPQYTHVPVTPVRGAHHELAQLQPSAFAYSPSAASASPSSAASHWGASHSTPSSQQQQQASSSRAQIQRVQQWLAQLDFDLQHSNSQSAQLTPALDTLAKIHSYVLTQQSSASSISALHPQPVPSYEIPVRASPPVSARASPMKGGVTMSPPSRSPPAVPQSAGRSAASPAASPRVMVSPVAAAAPVSAPPAAVAPTPAASAPSKHTTLMTIMPMQSSAGSSSIQGLPVQGAAFINGRWMKQSPSRASNGSPSSPSGANAGDDAEEDEEDDPFEDISDFEDNAPVTPRAQQQLLTVPAASASVAPLSSPSRKKIGSMSGSLRRRLNDPDGTGDINDDDVEGIDAGSDFDEDEETATAAAPSSAAAANAAAGAEAGADADDPFADIDDLEVDEEEEERLKEVERTRAHHRPSGSTDSQKSVGVIQRRAKMLANKTTTLRKDLSKHMGKDADIDEDDAAALEEIDDGPAAAPVPKTQQQQQQQQQTSGSPHPSKVDDVDAQLESPRVQKLFAPDLQSAKSEKGVTALNTRKEGQAEERDEWDDLELSGAHLRQASQSAVKQADERPDDLDGLDDEDEDQDQVTPVGAASSPPSRSRRGDISRGGSSDFSNSASPASMSRRALSSFQSAEDDDFSDMDLGSRVGLDGLSSLPSSSLSHHRHSASNMSVHSSVSQHGQLSGKLSLEDEEDMDGFMDDDDDEQKQEDLASRSEQQSENKRDHAAFFGSVVLHDVAVLRRPVDPDWLLSLAAECAPPAAVAHALPTPQQPQQEQEDNADAQAAAAAAVPAAAATPPPDAAVQDEEPEQLPAAAAAADAAAATPSTPVKPATHSRTNTPGSAAGSNRRKKHKKKSSGQ